MVGVVNYHPMTEETFNSIWTYFQSMTRDETKSHEHNKGNLGTFQHDDGWGISWIEDDQVKAFHSMEDINRFVLETKIRDSICTSSAFILHARKASPGIPIGEEYCHPFIRPSSNGEYALAHNGTIFEPKRFTVSQEPVSQSDSERLLLHLIHTMEDQDQEMQVVFEDVMTHLDNYSGANILLLHPTSFGVMVNYTKNPDYLTMSYLETDEHFVVASEDIPTISKEWVKMENHQLIWKNL
jgi:glutamine amidotransferase